jgi:hypothetical protein
VLLLGYYVKLLAHLFVGSNLSGLTGRHFVNLRQRLLAVHR